MDNNPTADYPRVNSTTSAADSRLTDSASLNDSLTEIELARLRADLQRIPFVRWLDIRLVEATRGTATLEMQVRDEMRQREGLLHGGVTVSLLDTVAAFAIFPLLAENETTTTVSLNVHFLRAVTGGTLRAHARVLRAGRRVVTVSAEISCDQADSKPVAAALLTFARTKKA